MINERNVLEILTDWNYWGNFSKEYIERENYLKKLEILSKGKEVIVIKGVRRSGKSAISYFFVNKIINSGIDPERTLIINFEDPRLPTNLNLNDVMKMFEIYLSNICNNPYIVVLDEIQYVNAWERFARYLSEAKNIKVIVTGSSSKLMSEEYATVLTGRHLDMEVFPLSFKEFLRFKNFEVKDKVDLIKKRFEIKKLLNEYLEFGGFPEVVLENTKERKFFLLNSYFNDILSKDIVKRYKIKRVSELENLAKYYISSISTLQSFRKISKFLNLSLHTVERFSRYLQTARLFIFLDNFRYSVKEQIRSKKKVYSIDLGFYELHGFKISENVGKRMENVVFLHLMRMIEFNPNLRVYYFRFNSREIDFLVKEGLNIKQLIQVTYANDKDEIDKREVDSLEKAYELFKKDKPELLIITWDYEDVIKRNNLEIKCMPLWKWLLQM